MSRYQKGKTSVDFTEARDREWQRHQLGRMQVCTSLQTDNHTRTSPLSFFTGRMPFLPPNQQHQSTEGKKLSIAINCSCNYPCESEGLYFYRRWFVCPFSYLTLLVGRQEGHPACKKLSSGVLAWLSVWNEVLMHMAQLMPLPLTVSCSSKIQTGFTFLVPAHPGSPGQGAIKRVCVCVLENRFRIG